MMRLDGAAPTLDTLGDVDLVIFDRWILSRLERTKEQVERRSTSTG
jgi:hypothetical protein